MHCLDYNDAKIARFTHSDCIKPWHREGVALSEGAGLEAHLAIAAPFDVKDQPVYTKINGEEILIPSKKLIYKEQEGGSINQLSVMGKDYTYAQPREIFSCLDDFLSKDVLRIETMASLRGGKSFFVCCSITGDPLEIIPGDYMDNFLLMADSYDGVLALTIAIVFLMAVCNNTMTAGLASALAKAKMRHTKNILGKNKVDAMMRELGIVKENSEALKHFAQFLAMQKVGTRETSDFFKAMVFKGKTIPADQKDWSPQQRRVYSELSFCNVEGPGQEIEGRRDTAWGLLNAVTGHNSWMASDPVNPKAGYNSIDRTQYSVFGTGNDSNLLAASLLASQYQYQLAA